MMSLIKMMLLLAQMMTLNDNNIVYKYEFVWRLDYWLVSDRAADKVEKSEMVDSGERQDHTPTLLEIDLA